MTKLFTCILFLFIALSSYSQTNTASVSGIVQSGLSQPAEAITVRVLHLPDSVITRVGNTDVKGYFILENIKAGRYTVLFTGVGYKKTYAGPYQLAAGEKFSTGIIKLAEEKFALSEVVIRDRKNYVEVKADKTILNVERNILATGTSVLSVLGTAPGVKVNSLGEIMMRAGQQAAVYVNGKQIKLQGADLATFLQNLQSADVSQVELIPNPPARYDASGAGGVINIILKKGANVGFNGNATATAGYGRFGKGGLTVNGNYRTKKVNIFGSTGFDYNKTYLTINTMRNISDAQHSSFNTQYYNTQSTPTYTYRFGTDIFIDSLHTLGFLIYGNNLTSSFDKSTNTALNKNNLPDSSFITTSNLKRHITGINYNINYQGAVGKHQTLSADADMTAYTRRSDERLITNRSAVGVRPMLPVFNFNNDTLTNLAPTHITNEAIKIDYSNKLSKADRFDAGIKGSYVNSTNNQYFNMLQNGIATPYAGLTSNFVYKEKIGAAYVSFAHNQTKLSYNAGLRVENLNSDANLVSNNDRVTRNYTNFFPSVQVVYKPKTAQYILDYNRRIDYLDYGIVNPIIAYQDNYNIRAGNPYLQPAVIDYLQLSYFRPSVMRLSLYAQQVSNFFNFNYFSQNDATKVLTTTKVNLRSYTSTGIIIDLPVKVSNWYNFNFNGDVAYQRYKDKQGFLDKGTQDVILKLNQNFIITPTLTATLYAQYESNTFYGVSSLKPNYFVSGGISKQFGKQATLTLNASDIFNTDRDRYYMNFANLDITGYQKKESQVFKLSFTYRFGKRSVKNNRRHTTGNIEEQRRINNSAGGS